MSYIEFTSLREGSAKLRGPERYHANHVCKRLLLAALDYRPNDVLAMDTPDSLPVLALDYSPSLTFETWLRIGDGFKFPADPTLFAALPESLQEKVTGGMGLDMFSLTLNTACAVGDDSVKLLARLHGQCEIHAWIDGPNRAWLAGIIKRGLRDSIYRPGMGWGDVIALLENSNEGEVVTSFSGSGGFPDFPSDVDISDDDWYEMRPENRWQLAMGYLREAPAPGLEMRPDNWGRYRFGHKVNGYEIRLIADTLKAQGQGWMPKPSW